MRSRSAGKHTTPAGRLPTRVGAPPARALRGGAVGGAGAGNQFGLNFDKMKFGSGFGGKFRTGGAGQAFSKMFNKDKGAGGE